MSNHSLLSDILMQARITDQTAFIMRRREWRNTSLIVDLFTLDYGCVSALAKGARGSASSSRYQPFTPLQVNWTGQRELKTLTSVESFNLPVSEKNYLALLYINDLTLGLLPKAEPHLEIFEAYLQLLHLAAEPLKEENLRRYELELVSQLGYFPDISHEADTGALIEADGCYHFEIGKGFVNCSPTSPDAVDGGMIHDWLSGRYERDQVCRLAKSVLRSTIDFNLHGKALKSRDVSREILRRK
ncbi:MAG: DNA repair protein RecO [Pseudomonadota bacterium]